MSKAGSLSLTVRADEIPAGGRAFHIEAADDERHALSQTLGIPEVRDLVADLTIRPLGGAAFAVSGHLEASVVQTDVVTLEPVEQSVSEAIDLTLVPEAEVAAGRPAGEAEPAEAGEGPDTFANGRIELGTLAAEHLALGLDPYPRAPGSEFAGYAEDDSLPASPFAALARLKKDGK
jgi:hypothetical protein